MPAPWDRKRAPKPTRCWHYCCPGLPTHELRIGNGWPVPDSIVLVCEAHATGRFPRDFRMTAPWGGR